jgi:hypothetical protein
MAVPDSKKLRVITNHVDFITTAKSIRNGVGMSMKFNAAMLTILQDLDNMYTPKSSVRGLVQTVDGFSIQISVL